MKPIGVSVVLTSYNHAPYLRQAIDSVLRQTYKDLELIIVDNGSTDESSAIIKEYEHLPNVAVIWNRTNVNHTVICNVGVRAARGAYIGFLHSDDYYLPEKIQMQVEKFESLSARCGVVYSGGYLQLEGTSQLCLDDRPKHRGHILKKLLTEPNFILPISPLFRRECLLEFPFYEDLKYEGEFILTRIATRYEFEYVDTPLVVVRENPVSRGKNIHETLQINLDLYERLFENPAFPPEYADLKRLAIARILTLKGWQLIRERRAYSQGGRLTRQALKTDWRSVRDYRVLLGSLFSFVPTPVADGLSCCFDGVRRGAK